MQLQKLIDGDVEEEQEGVLPQNLSGKGFQKVRVVPMSVAVPYSSLFQFSSVLLSSSSSILLKVLFGSFSPVILSSLPSTSVQNGLSCFSTVLYPETLSLPLTYLFLKVKWAEVAAYVGCDWHGVPVLTHQCEFRW